MWFWTAVAAAANEWMGFIWGDRSTLTGLKLWQSIAGRLQKALSLATDHGEAYKDVVPPDKHLRMKAATSWIEGFNSRLRPYLARLHRKTKCYAKSMDMLQRSVKLLILKLKHSPTIFS